MPTIQGQEDLDCQEFQGSNWLPQRMRTALSTAFVIWAIGEPKVAYQVSRITMSLILDIDTEVNFLPVRLAGFCRFLPSENYDLLIDGHCSARLRELLWIHLCCPHSLIPAQSTNLESPSAIVPTPPRQPG